ncbi:putative chaperone clp [Cardiosporidium cionae]|uniref:Chaperone clp n=1 Tax=Cardiosporidium cionae TaxID=476202 RepID=A0ABQ7J6D3_9APIC|nr:putative chaperone clp [Cardiosporidium cionae]|eukprot:KAF8819250.1 putative chaperone clp [Cardiosporidium cionae]
MYPSTFFSFYYIYGSILWFFLYSLVEIPTEAAQRYRFPPTPKLERGFSLSQSSISPTKVGCLQALPSYPFAFIISEKANPKRWIYPPIHSLFPLKDSLASTGFVSLPYSAGTGRSLHPKGNHPRYPSFCTSHHGSPFHSTSSFPIASSSRKERVTSLMATNRLSMMFENFTEKAIKVIMLAQEESRRVGHNFVGTEQLFLGLVGQMDGIAGKVLKNVGLTLVEARKKVDEIVGKGSGFVAPEIPFTPHAKQALQSAMEEAKLLRHMYIDTEHLLLGVLKEEEGTLSKVLASLNCDKNKIRAELIKILSDTEEFTTIGARSEQFRAAPTLQEFSVDLTEKAIKGELDPVVGRTKEIDRLIQILVRRSKSNPILIGEPGVGKTAIAEGLAQRIANKDIPLLLEKKRVCLLDMGLLVAGTKYRGEFEERLKKLMEDIRKAENIILVVDEIHTMIGTSYTFSTLSFC